MPSLGRTAARRRLGEAALIAVLGLGTAGPWSRTGAAEIPTGVAGLSLRLDVMTRLNAGLRVEPVDELMGRSPAFGAGELRVEQGGLTTARLDLLPELDLGWRERIGLRASGAFWYDAAYADAAVRRDPSLVAAGVPGTYVGDRLSTYTLDRYRGPWGELLDAFAWGRLDLGGVPLTIKAGRHTVFWGEALMQAGVVHGIAYSQMALDLQKGFATPGLEAKELFRPLGAVSAQAQLTPTLSLAAQVLLEWQSFVYPEGATFLGPVDFAFNGPDGIYRNMGGTPVYLANAGVSRPGLGEWGVALRWAPSWLDGTAGLHYRRFTDKLPALLLTSNPGGQGPLSPALPSPYAYRQYYGEGIDLVGLSLSKQLLGVSVGAEASWRHGMPLLAQSLGFAVAPAPPLAPVLFPSGAPVLVGNSYQARGDTFHAVLNAVGVFTGRPVFSSASWAAELTYSRWLRVGENPDMFYGEGYGVCRSDPALTSAGLARTWQDGCATRDAAGASAAFSPTWYQVFPDVDLSLPLALAWTFHGNSPVTLGGNVGSGTWSAGVGADVVNRWRFDLKYVDFFGDTTENGSMVTSTNGLLALLKSRGSLTFTAKATF